MSNRSFTGLLHTQIGLNRSCDASATRNLFGRRRKTAEGYPQRWNREASAVHEREPEPAGGYFSACRNAWKHLYRTDLPWGL